MPRRKQNTSERAKWLRNAESLKNFEIERLLDAICGIPGYDPFRKCDGHYFDVATARRATGFFSHCLTHVKGGAAGEPFVLQPWQEAVVLNLFGWKQEQTDLRRYRECLVYVPRKNGKTTLAAGLCLFLLFADGEPGAEIYCAAANEEQAEIVFTTAKYQVLRDGVLKRRARVFKRSILVNGTASFFRALSRKADTKHGLNAHAICIDELHAQQDRELVDVLFTSTASRRQPLVFCITTADYERAGSICNEKHNYASRVRDGIVDDPAFLPVIYEATKDDDWTSPKTWAKANPNLGVSVSLEYIERECKRAQEILSYENTFKRLHCNLRTEQETRWIRLGTWDGCAGEIDWKEYEGRLCYGGLDVAAVHDLTAFVLVFPSDTEPRDYRILPFFWVPRKDAEVRSRRDGVPYVTWVRNGLVEYAGEESIDQSIVCRRILELAQRYQIMQVGYDPWNAIAMQQALEDQGVKMVQVPQGYGHMNAPSKEFEAALCSGRIHHDGHPVLRWMASNVSVREKGGAIRPAKEKSAEKIDGIVATVIAISQALTHEGVVSSYNDGTKGFNFL